MATVTVYDRVKITSRTVTPEGYMKAPARISVAGNVQRYSARELGLDGEGMDANRMVALYRPRDEVFAPDAIASFEGKPVTFHHPPEPVTSDNWKKYSVGDAHGVHPEGDGVHASLIIRDANAVKGVTDGTCEMSNGYSFELDMTPGVAPSGAAYDGVQRKLRGNHIAIVDMARGGRTCRIGDEDTTTTTETSKERHMATRKIVIDTVTFDLEDAQATLLERIDADHKTKLKGASDAAATAVTRAETAERALTEEREKSAKLVADHAKALEEAQKKIPTEAQIQAMVDEKRQQATDAQIEALGEERAQVIAAATKMSPGIVTAKVPVAKIRQAALAAILAGDTALKAVVSAGLGGLAPDKADAGLVKAVFAMADAAIPAAHATTDASDGDRDALDAERARANLGRGLNLMGAGEPDSGSGGGPVRSAMDVQRYREANGGKLPAWAAQKQ